MPYPDVNIILPDAVGAIEKDLTEKLYNVEIKGDNPLIVCREKIQITKTALTSLHIYLESAHFKSKEEEIVFFKIFKPKIFARLLYNSKLYRIELRRPLGGIQTEENYLNRELDKLSSFFEANKGFYEYYRSGAEDLDERYFLRGEKVFDPLMDLVYLEADPHFTTGYDNIVAKILANEGVRDYLVEGLSKLKQKAMPKIGEHRPFPALNWTGTLVALNELIYSLKASGAINNGNVTVSDIALGMEILLNVKTGNIFRRQQEIRIRANRAAFLDILKKNYIAEMDKTDENPHPSSK